MFLFLRPRGACIHTSINVFCDFQFQGTWKFIDVVFLELQLQEPYKIKRALFFDFQVTAPPKKKQRENKKITTDGAMVKLAKKRRKG